MSVRTEQGFEAEMCPPTSEAVAVSVLASAEALWTDPLVAEMLHDELGVVRTPFEVGKDVGGHEVYFKDERMQPSSSYKSRGASVAVMRSPADVLVTTYSTGNHGRSVAIAAQLRGHETVVEATETISPTKLEHLQETGADVRPVHKRFRDAQLAAEAGAGVVIAPFGNCDVLAGQCTLGQEIVEDLVERGLAQQTVIIPVAVAGGGHLFGVAAPIWAAKQAGVLGPDVHVIGVQPQGNNTLGRAVAKVQAGEEPINLYAPGEKQDTLCDALVITEESLSPDTLAVAANPAFVRGFVAMDRLDIARGVLALEAQLGGTVEPAAALPYAFARQYAAMFPTEAGHEPVTFVLPISGGNRSASTLQECELIVARAQFAELSAAHLDATDRPDAVTECVGRTSVAVGNRVLSGAVIHGYPATVEGSPGLQVQDKPGLRAAYLAQLAGEGIELLR